MAAVRHRLDVFGVLVLAFAAGNAGGITRDVLIGAVPPAAIADWRYVAVSALAGLVTFWLHRTIIRLWHAVRGVGRAQSARLRTQSPRWGAARDAHGYWRRHAPRRAHHGDPDRASGRA